MEEGLAEADYVNDLELPAFKAMPSLQQMKTELEVWIAVVSEQILGSLLYRLGTLSERPPVRISETFQEIELYW